MLICGLLLFHWHVLAGDGHVDGVMEVHVVYYALRFLDTRQQNFKRILFSDITAVDNITWRRIDRHRQ